MLFITQGKTNWNLLLFVAILASIVGGGTLWWQEQKEIELVQLGQAVDQTEEDNSILTPDIFFTTDKTDYLPWEFVKLTYSSDLITYSDYSLSRNIRRQVYSEETGEWKYLDEDLSDDINCKETFEKGKTLEQSFDWGEVGAWYKEEITKIPRFRIAYYYSKDTNCEEIKTAYSNEFTIRTPELGEEADDYFKSCFEESQKIKDDCEEQFDYLAYSSLEECFNELSQEAKDLCLLVPVSSVAFDEQYLYYCDNISDSLLRDYCYKKAATLSEETALCNKIQDKNIKENCYARLEGKTEPFPSQKCITDNDCIVNCDSCINKEDKTPFICEIFAPVYYMFQTTDNEYSPGDDVSHIPGSVPFGNDPAGWNHSMFIEDVCKYLECAAMTCLSAHCSQCDVNEEGYICARVIKCSCVDNVCKGERVCVCPD